MVFSVRLSVCPSVPPSVTPFRLCSHHRIIMKFSGFITKDQSKVHAKGQGQRSKVKVTETTTQLKRFRTVTLVWIHIWWRNDTYSLMLLRGGALWFFKVIRQIETYIIHVFLTADSSKRLDHIPRAVCKSNETRVQVQGKPKFPHGKGKWIGVSNYIQKEAWNIPVHKSNYLF